MSSLKFPLSDKEAKDLNIKKSTPDNRNALFPTRLRELRAKKRTPKGEVITQQVLAEEIGVTKSTISLYEMGDNVPDAKTIVKIADYYHVSTDYLLGRIDVKSPEIDNMAMHEKTGLSEESINKLFDKKNNSLFSYLIEGKEYLGITAEGKESKNIAEIRGQDIKMLYKNNFIKTVDILIKSEFSIIDDISDFLFNNFLNADRVSDSDTGHFFRAQQRGQINIQPIETSELNAIYLLKAQAKLLALKNELAKESK